MATRAANRSNKYTLNNLFSGRILMKICKFYVFYINLVADNTCFAIHI